MISYWVQIISPAKAANQDLSFLQALNSTEAFHNQAEWRGELGCTTSLTRLRSPR